MFCCRNLAHRISVTLRRIRRRVAGIILQNCVVDAITEIVEREVNNNCIIVRISNASAVKKSDTPTLRDSKRFSTNHMISATTQVIRLPILGRNAVRRSLHQACPVLPWTPNQRTAPSWIPPPYCEPIILSIRFLHRLIPVAQTLWVTCTRFDAQCCGEAIQKSCIKSVCMQYQTKKLCGEAFSRLFIHTYTYIYHFSWK